MENNIIRLVLLVVIFAAIYYAMVMMYVEIGIDRPMLMLLSVIASAVIVSLYKPRS